jgi:hypothetical protein
VIEQAIGAQKQDRQGGRSEYGRMIDWNDRAACLALIERVGVVEYNRLHAEHCLQLQALAKTVNGHAISKTTFFTVADRSFYTLDQATEYARNLRRRQRAVN